jgi:flagellar hook capping protein FlgD
MRLGHAALVGVMLVALPPLARATPALVVRESSWEPVSDRLVLSESRLSLNGVLALRALEVRVREPFAPGESMALRCPSPTGGATMLPPKEIGGPRTLVFAVVFPGTIVGPTDDVLPDLGDLQCIVARDAGNPPITAQGVLRDGSRIDLPISYQRAASHEQAISSGPRGLLLAPNPTPGSTEVRYRVDVTLEVDMAVFDMQGRRVRNLFRGVQEPGEHSLRWDGRDDLQRLMPMGVYVLKLQTNQGTRTQRLILMR